MEHLPGFSSSGLQLASHGIKLFILRQHTKSFMYHCPRCTASGMASQLTTFSIINPVLRPP